MHAPHCKQCGKSFRRVQGTQIYCGPNCKAAAYRKRNRTWYPSRESCDQCGKPYMTKHTHSRYCSHRKQDAKNVRRRKVRLANWGLDVSELAAANPMAVFRAPR